MQGSDPVLDPAAQPVLVIGGGVTGQRAALDLAHVGLDVLLLEQSPSLGGTVAQLGSMFPLHNCLLCRAEPRHGPGCTRPTLAAELLDHARPANLQVWTQSRVLHVEDPQPGSEGGEWRVTVQCQPRYVEPALCINCDRCAQACPQSLPDPFQAGLTQRKAAYKPALRAVPDAYVIEQGDYCLGCGRCAAVCPTHAIDLAQPATTLTLTARAVVLATGMQLYDASLSQEYGYGRYPNVLTGLELERMASPAGPGEGRIVRRSDGAAPRRIAWLQCVGSRDEKHDYCSAFCCGYATRQAVLARQLLPDANAHIYIMDDRVFAKGLSATYDPLRAAYGVRLERCRPSTLREDPATHDLLLQVTGADGRVLEERFGMVVLSVGAQAAAGATELAQAFGLAADPFGFIRTGALAPVDTARPGLFVAGAAAGPADIADSVVQGSAAAARVCASLGHQLPPAPKVDITHTAAPAPEPQRVGVFVCDCAGEIGATLDLPQLLRYAATLPGVSLAEAVPYGCLPDGLEIMRQRMRAQGLTHLIVGACTPRTYGPLFERALPAQVRVVSLREECAYVHRADPAGATRQAQELLRVAVAQLGSLASDRRQPASTPITYPPVRSALVVGGGLAGLTAALHLAGSGIPVHLVERQATLGGNALRLGQTAEGEDLPAAVRHLAERALAEPRITVHTSCEVARHAGRLGQFTVTLRSRSEPSPLSELQVGATIVATGGQEYRGRAYGLGMTSRVLTLLDFEQALGPVAASSSLTALSEEGSGVRALPMPLQQVAFVGCVGPWDEPANAASWRCSRTCCERMIRQAHRLKTAYPACQVLVLNREINTYAFREEQYTAARRAGVLFVRFDSAHRPSVEQTPAGLRLLVRETTLGETLELHPDLLLLASAILPQADAADTSAVLGVPQAGEGFFREWETKTRPYAALEPGFYLCGLAHGPKPSHETVAQALAAAQQVAILLSRPRLVLNPVVARVDQQRCVGCLTCTRVCPYNVPRLEPAQTAHVGGRGKSFIEPARCQGCGTCVADCPGQAIELAQYSNQQVAGMGVLGRWLVATPA